MHFRLYKTPKQPILDWRNKSCIKKKQDEKKRAQLCWQIYSQAGWPLLEIEINLQHSTPPLELSLTSITLSLYSFICMWDCTYLSTCQKFAIIRRDKWHMKQKTNNIQKVALMTRDTLVIDLTCAPTILTCSIEINCVVVQGFIMSTDFKSIM
jgi:hypothetical protein